MKVIKFGGGCLKDAGHVRRVLDLLAREPQPCLVVVSALAGVTDLLLAGMEAALRSGAAAPEAREEIGRRHRRLADELIPTGEERVRVEKQIGERLRRLERLVCGVAYTGEITPSLSAAIASFGERLAATLLAGALRESGVPAEAIDADEIGMVTDDAHANATADLAEVRRRFAETVRPWFDRGVLPVLTGYFGCTPAGRVTTFGRNGSDYSAAVCAAALDASILEIWKDVDGFMSADPKRVPEAHRIARLSYSEAAELSYFGAKVLHPRTVEPLAPAGVPIRVRSLFDPDSPGTEIGGRAGVSADVVKSVTCNRNLAALSVQGSGVGCKPGVIGAIGDILAAAGINILSIVTSQTCINLLVDAPDADAGLAALRRMQGGVIERVEAERELALIAVVGEGLKRTGGIAARLFSAVSAERINVELISSGASAVATYFVVGRDDADRAVSAIHRQFFPIHAQPAGQSREQPLFWP